MRRGPLLLSPLLLGLLLLLAPGGAAEATPHATAQAIAGAASRATVLSIGDGDTIRVRQGQQRLTVRLACIDAPELAQAPDGARARDDLRSRLPLGSTVTLRTVAVDRYGRTVAEVIDQVNLGLALVEDGMAFAYRRYLNNCDAAKYLAAEERASRRRSGVWRFPGGLKRPWDFRRERREARSARPMAAQ